MGIAHYQSTKPGTWAMILDPGTHSGH